MTGEVRTEKACYEFPSTVRGPFGFQLFGNKTETRATVFLRSE